MQSFINFVWLLAGVEEILLTINLLQASLQMFESDSNF